MSRWVDGTVQRLTASRDSFCQHLRMRSIRPSANFARERVGAIDRRVDEADELHAGIGLVRIQMPAAHLSAADDRRLGPCGLDDLPDAAFVALGAMTAAPALPQTACGADSFFIVLATTAATRSTYSRSRLSSSGIQTTCFRRSSARGHSPSLYS